MLNLIFQSIHKVKKLFKKNHLNFSGPFKSWDEAVINSSGYDSEIVLKKVSNAMREVLEGLRPMKGMELVSRISQLKILLFQF